MGSYVLRLAVIAVVCGAAMSMMPEGSTKKLTQLLSTAILLSAIMSFGKDFNLDTYIQQAAAFEERETEFTEDFEKSHVELKASIIEKQCAEYILDKAGEYGITVSKIRLELGTEEKNMFYPYSVEIYGKWDIASKKELGRLICLELGIPEERQYWQNESQQQDN